MLPEQARVGLVILGGRYGSPPFATISPNKANVQPCGRPAGLGRIPEQSQCQTLRPSQSR